MKILIKDTNTIASITMTDPKTGINWEADYIGENISDCDYEDPTGDFVDLVEMVMTRENFDWWKKQCAEYESSDEKLYTLRNNPKFQDEYGTTSELDEEFHQYINGFDFNSQPKAMSQFCDDWEETHK